MTRTLHASILSLVAIATIALSVWGMHDRDETRIRRLGAQDELVDQARASIAAAEMHVRAGDAAGPRAWLDPVRAQRRAFHRYMGALRDTSATGDGEVRVLLDAIDDAADAWGDAVDGLAALRRAGSAPGVRIAAVHGRRAAALRAFGAATIRLDALLDARRARALGSSTVAHVGIVLVLCCMFALAGWVVTLRGDRTLARLRHQEAAYRAGQQDLVATLQAMDREDDAHLAVKRHLERAVPRATITVLSRDDGANRLVPRTPVPAGTALAAALEDAEPRDCLAVRLGRRHESAGDTLLECHLCGATAASLTTCTPMVVSGEVIGSVLVGHEAPLGEAERRVVRASVASAAPVVGTMRMLALAETRAATDALTGLPNRRALHETLPRMLAHASRTGTPLGVVTFDLDHFKDVNDRFGHAKGDDVLAAVGLVLAATVRQSDVAGRNGGEEFLVLAPGADHAAAERLAEKLRVAMCRLEVPGVERAITASFGVAAYPEDAIDSETLLRKADRALYAAKRSGRNRVEGGGALALPAG